MLGIDGAIIGYKIETTERFHDRMAPGFDMQCAVRHHGRPYEAAISCDLRERAEDVDARDGPGTIDELARKIGELGHHRVEELSLERDLLRTSAEDAVLKLFEPVIAKTLSVGEALPPNKLGAQGVGMGLPNFIIIPERLRILDLEALDARRSADVVLKREQMIAARSSQTYQLDELS